MTTIVTRAGKGSPLTNNEVDANFTNLNSDKVETSAISTFGGTLIDDADAATARTTLGLGTAATTASTDYATAAQGALADSALQSADNLSDLADAATARTNLGLGSAATSAATDFVAKTSATGSAEIPTGTDAQRDGTPSAGYFRFNTDSSSFEGYDGTAWGAIGGGSVDLSAVDQDILPDADSTRDIGSTSKRWAQGWFDDVTATTADINGGTIDGTVIGGSTPAAISGTTGTFSSALTGTDLTLSGGVYLGGTGSANYLDDYEEGTWTPQVRGSGTAGTYTYGVQKGAYSKIGNIVTADFALFSIVVSSAGTGYIQITGLPFLKANNAYPVGALNLSSMNWGALVTSAVLSFTSGSATDVLYMRAIGSNSGGLDILTSAISSGASTIQGSITYVV